MAARTGARDDQFERIWQDGRRSEVYRAGATGLEPATSGVTGQRSNRLSYAPSEGA
jgi:hypothetical protein